MPNDVKAIVSLLTLLVAIGFAWFVIGFAVFAVLAMWVFPEAQGGKPEPRNSRRPE